FHINHIFHKATKNIRSKSRQAGNFFPPAFTSSIIVSPFSSLPLFFLPVLQIPQLLSIPLRFGFLLTEVIKQE
ncbi:hypothetical protein, partial [Bacteroides sp.]